jgi:hypothetical protein
VVQRLPVGSRHDGCQLHHGLVVLTRQEQADEVVAQGGALLDAREQLVKGGKN